MLVLKKGVAAIGMVLSIIAVVVLIISLFGSWVIRGRLEVTSIDLLLTGENVIATTQERLERVDEILRTTHGVMTEIDTRVQERGATVQESDPGFVQWLDSRGVDLRTGMENAAEVFNQVEANIIAVNEAVNAIKAIPLLNLENHLPDTTKLQEVQDSMAQIREQVTTLIETTQNRRSDLIQGKVDAITGLTTGMSDRLGVTRNNLEEVNVRLAETSQSMASLRERIPSLYTRLTILLNLMILLALLAFTSLFFHAWHYFKCPQHGLSELVPGDCEKVATIS